MKAGVPVRIKETIKIGSKTTTARGSRYLSLKDYENQVAAGMLIVLEEERDKQGNLKKVKVESTRYIESDTSILNRVLGREVGGKQNILVLNDEAHHAYRIDVTSRNREEEEWRRRRKLRSFSRRPPSGLMVWTKSKSCAGSTFASTSRPHRIF